MGWGRVEGDAGRGSTYTDPHLRTHVCPCDYPLLEGVQVRSSIHSLMTNFHHKRLGTRYTVIHFIGEQTIVYPQHPNAPLVPSTTHTAWVYMYMLSFCGFRSSIFVQKPVNIQNDSLRDREVESHQNLGRSCFLRQACLC